MRDCRAPVLNQVFVLRAQWDRDACDQLCACNAGHRHTHIYPTHREPHFFKRAVKLKKVMQGRSDCQSSLDIYLPWHNRLLKSIFSALRCLTPATLNLPQQRSVWRKPLSLVSCNQTHLTTGFLSCCSTVWIFYLCWYFTFSSVGFLVDVQPCYSQKTPAYGNVYLVESYCRCSILVSRCLSWWELFMFLNVWLLVICVKCQNCYSHACHFPTTFTFIHFADTLIQSHLQMRSTFCHRVSSMHGMQLLACL